MRRQTLNPVRLPRHLLNSVEKPARYVGGEWNLVQKQSDVPIRFAFAFPDVYEIGMSNLALRILYSQLNQRDDTWCERVFAPWTDMEAGLRRLGLPLHSLESKTPLAGFDLIGFTLQYELSFTNVLNMLDLAGIPLRSAERDAQWPLIIGGGPVACHAEPLADAFDLLLIGEGEELTDELLDCYRRFNEAPEGFDKAAFLRAAAGIEGIYVPSLYTIRYQADGRIEAIEPAGPDVPVRIRRRVVQDLNQVGWLEHDLVPNTEIVHDRMFLEVMRGCPRGCRFCQAGMLYRPLRQRSVETLVDQADQLQTATGYDELGLLSLSTSDYQALGPLTDQLLCHLTPQRTSLSLPSLRLDSFSLELMEKASSTRKSGLTFAPEAGTQRLRDVINKQIATDDLMDAMRLAFDGGWSGAKLYFMLGLPTETMEDVEGIAEMTESIRRLYRERPGKAKRRLTLTVSAAYFIPKPFTPFQWVAQEDQEQVWQKVSRLRDLLRRQGIRLQWHDLPSGRLEAVLARGDRRLFHVLESAWRNGQTFTAWSDHFDETAWEAAFAEAGLDPAFYANRERDRSEVLPWDHIDIGVRRGFLWREYEKSLQGQLTAECRVACSACGARVYEGGICLEYDSRTANAEG